MRMSEKCRNKHKNNSSNPLTSHRTDGVKRYTFTQDMSTLDEQCTHLSCLESFQRLDQVNFGAKLY